MSPERRRRPGRLGAHPERRALARTLRDALAAAAPPLSLRARSARRAVVLPPVVNMFARASRSAPVVSQAVLGARVAVVKRIPGWALCETGDRYRGWIRAAALAADRRDGSLFEVASLFANVYSERDVTTRAPIAVLPILARVEATPAGGGEHERTWTRVRLPDGRRGFVQHADLRPADAPPTPAAERPGRVVATALRFLGLPYLWGGTTPFGLDCSGLVQLAHRVHGVFLPRDADLQWADRRLLSVARGRLRPGDLVFFGPGKRSITHVGIALGGRAFVNATTRGVPVVRIDRLEDPGWRVLWRGARRLPGTRR
ncbi:MAG TPA: C40 family peptidase [Dongiaceae bacterium]|nr:C40 family peptidase [Dongiaceae bacterium]